ncbi:sugar transferase [Derxia gummosa]|uniref:Sugar transferase n=1 Tax=Derxia gummosa DSM 723 TaxID=1121388 RepID=A0AC36KLL7_9BURK
MILQTPQVAFSRGRASFIGLVRMSVEPTIVVLSLLVAALLAGHPFGGAELVLAMIAFSLTFPGEVSIRKIKRGLLVSVCAGWFLTFGLMLFFGWATRFIWHFDPLMLAVWFAITPVALYAAHRIIPRLTPQLLAIDGFRKTVVVAANDAGRKLARNLREEPALGFQFVGFFDDRTGDRQPPLEEGPLLGSIDTVAEYVKKNAVEAVFIALPMAHQPRLLALLDEMKDTTASIYFVPDIFMFDLIQARIDDINGVPVLAVCETPFVGINGLVKRISDVILASLIILMISPILAVVALGVKLSSPGPIIFRQRRYGLDGREIMVFKFRSMTVTENGGEVKQAQRNDKRITPFGRLPAQDLARRTAAVLQCAHRHDEHRRPPAARGRAQRAVPQAHQGLHDSPQGQAGHHRLGAGERLSRRDRDPRQDAGADRIRPRIPAPLVPRPRPVHRLEDTRGVHQPNQRVLNLASRCGPGRSARNPTLLSLPCESTCVTAPS